jgi:two-component system chemotaxis sensor kinase CheA
MRALLFLDMDGARRVVPLAVVDRVEHVPTDAVQQAAGALRLTIDGEIIPLVARGAVHDRGTIGVIRVDDGVTQLGYAIAEALDIVDLPPDFVPAREPGPVAGVTMIDDQPVEMLDLHWLFAEHADPGNVEEAPLCLLTGSDASWMANFLRPVIEAAGYRIGTELRAGDMPRLALAMEDDPEVVSEHGVPVVRLSRRKAPRVQRGDLIYRYDRATLVSILEQYRAAGGVR